MTWKAKLVEKFPKMTRRQIYYIVAVFGLLAIIIFVPMSIKYKGFQCDKLAVEVKKK